jgi:SAM-dependent methyltransferase
MSEETSWSRLFKYRVEIHKRYPDIWDLKIARKRFPLMRKHIRNGEKILDIGASNRDLEKRLKKVFPDVVYKTMDIDREQVHDYYSLEEIRESFDVAFLFEVIEHLDLAEGQVLLKTIHGLLSKGGRLILTTPNIFNPSRFWRDATHKVAYCYDELGGLLLSQGYTVQSMHRVYGAPMLRYLLRVYGMSVLHRALGIDFAKSVLVVAEKGMG